MRHDLLFECERPQAENGVPHDWIPNDPAAFLLRSLSGCPSMFVDGDLDGSTALP